MKKRILIFALCMTALLSMAGCGDTDESSSRKKNNSSKTAAVNESSSESSEEDSSENDSSSGNESSSQIDTEQKTASAEIGKNGAKAVYKAELVSEDSDIADKVQFSDQYGRNVLHTGVVGLVGAPIEVSFDADEVNGGNLIYYINKNELHGIRPDALIFMRYNEEKDSYEIQENTVINEESELTAQLQIDRPGVYLLVNRFTWLNAWGAELDDDGYEKGYVPGADDIAPTGDWEHNEDTGDILKLADKDYLMKCIESSGATFNVSTPEQLATACYYANCCRLDRGNTPHIEINIENDIDLAGIDWAPIGWDMAGIDHRFTGNINGNGHTIKNLTVKQRYKSGFIGDSIMCTVIDLKIENADVQGTECGVLIGSDLNSVISKVECSGVVNGGSAGSLAGDARGTSYTDCKADVIVNGEDFGNKYYSYYDKDNARVSEEFGRPEKLKVKGSKVVREAGLEEKYENLGWNISTGLKRNAENETELDLGELYGSGEYTVELTAWKDGYYIPISEPVKAVVK